MRNDAIKKEIQLLEFNLKNLSESKKAKLKKLQEACK